MSTLKVLAAIGVLSAGLPVFAQGLPGTVMQVEGQVALGGTALTQRSAENMVVKAGQMLATGSGTVSVELTPGVALHLDRASAVKLVAVEAGRSEVMLQSGRAEVEIREYSGTHDVLIDTAKGVQTTLLEHGLYEFDAKSGELRVMDGKAAVSQTQGAKWVDVKGGHEIALNGVAAKSDEFADGREYGDYGGEGYGGYGYPGYGFEGAYPGYGYGPGFGVFAPFGFYPGFYGGGFYGGGFYGGGFYGGGFGRGGFGRGGGFGWRR